MGSGRKGTITIGEEYALVSVAGALVVATPAAVVANTVEADESTGLLDAMDEAVLA